MKRIIVDYKKLTKEILTLLATKYPHGYGDSDIINFKNTRNEAIEAIELKTKNTIYLVKTGKHLVSFMDSFNRNEDNFKGALDDTLQLSK